jgi:hypothetical protein
VLSSRQKARRVDIRQLYAIRSFEMPLQIPLPPGISFKRMFTLSVRFHCFHVSSIRVSPVFLGQIVRSLFSETCSETCCFDEVPTITADSSRHFIIRTAQNAETRSLCWIVSIFPRKHPVDSQEIEKVGTLET